MRIVRVYPRLLVGGAESHVLQLLAGIPGTEMVVPGVEGLSGEAARRLARSYTVIPPPRLVPLVQALRGADIVHIHTVNNEPILPLAAQLAAPKRIVLTVHNNFEADYSRIADHSFVVGVETQALLPAPSRVSMLPEGVAVPDTLPPLTPWRAGERPVRLVEIRRPDKGMAFTLDELIAAGALDGVDFEAVVIGVDGPSPDPRVRRLGELADPYPWIQRADLLVHGSAAETFGRTVYEAMACGALPLTTPLPAFRQRLTDGVHALLAEGLRVEDGVALLRRGLAALRDEAALRRGRIARHAWVKAHASVEGMVAAQAAGYERVLAAPPAPRSFLPGDVPEAVLPALADVLDRITRQLPLSGRDVDALPPPARAIALWMLVDTGRIPDDLQVPMLRGAIGVLGERPALCLSLGVAARKLGQVDLARAAFARTRALDPALMSPHLELVDLHLRQGDRDGALEALEVLLQTNPDYAPAHRYREAILRGGGGEQRRGPFAALRRHKRIIVTGPHRSGTTAAAEMIAADTGFEPVREEAFDFYNADRLRTLLRREGIVVQCPALFDLMPELSDPDTAIVLMRRPLAELAASRSRMFAPMSGQQLSADEQNAEQLARLGAEGGDAAALKYQRWAGWRARGALHHPIELDYAALAQHPMWVPPEQRRRLGKRWHNRRTRL